MVAGQPPRHDLLTEELYFFSWQKPARKLSITKIQHKKHAMPPRRR
jgi:hypothetical protein